MPPSPPPDLFARFGGPASQRLNDWLRVNNRTAHHVEWLTGGHSEAVVATVIVNEPGVPAHKLVVKLCPPTSDDGPREPNRHREAVLRSPLGFVRRHLVTPDRYDAMSVRGGGVLLFQEIADGGRDGLRSLEHIQDTRPVALGAACATIVGSLLGDWNQETRSVTLGVREYLQTSLVRPVRPDGPGPPWLAAARAMLPADTPADTPWVTLPEEATPLPNPIGLLLGASLGAGLVERAVVGHTHGDLHLGNVLVPAEPKVNAAGYRLIDLAWYSPDAPLARDPQMLVTSIAARCLPDLSHPQREALLGCLVATDPAAEAVLPVWLRDTIVKLRRATDGWAAKHGLAKEFAAQSRLSLVAAALPWVGRAAIPADPDTARRWFLRLAARAAAAYLQARDHTGGLLTVHAAAPATGRQTAGHPAGPAMTRSPAAAGDEPESVLSTREHAELDAILRDVRCSSAAALYDAAVAPLGPRHRGDRDLPAMARQLADVTGLPGALPPLLVFLERLADAVGGRHATALRDWTARFAASRNLDRHALGGLRAAPSPPGASRHSYLMVQLRKAPTQPRRYLTTVSLHHHTGSVESRWQTDEPLTLAHIRTRLGALVSDVMEEYGPELGDLVVEFFLPHGLIDTPVDQWPCGAAHDYGYSRLGVEHTVVVRSVRRLDQRAWYGHWQQKWRWLRDYGHHGGERAIHWLDRQENGPLALRAWLISGAHISVVILSFTPKRINYRKNDEVSVGISAGIPVLLWCRDPQSTRAFRTEIGKLLAGRSVLELPDQVRWLRRQAAQRHGATHDLGRQLTLLWDNPDRVPTAPPRLQPPI